MTKKIPTIIFALIAAIVTLSTVMNVFGDNSDVLALADAQVCQGKAKCSFGKTSVARTPIGQYVTFTDGKSTLQVTCRRAAIAFGDYSCSAAKAP